MIGDTIFAIASPPGPGARGVIRISGPAAIPLAATVTRGALAPRRAQIETSVAALGHEVECLALVMPAPRSYTGEDVVELHLPGSPLLLESICARLRGNARDATPGEFTRRAFEHGRLDLAGAEAVCALIHAASAAERRASLAVLRGGLADGIGAARATIQDALALIESGLDFTEGETGAVAPSGALPALARAAADLERLATALPRAPGGGELLLLGAASAGKSSLANALLGRDELLVDAAPGTTRDVVAVALANDVVLLDSPGDSPGAGVEADAVALRDRVATRARAAILVVDLSAPLFPATPLAVVAVVLTKRDLVAELPVQDLPRSAPAFVVSSVTGLGIDALRAFLVGLGPGAAHPGLGRAADHLRAASACLTVASDSIHSAPEAQTVAIELGYALAQLDQVHGHSSPEDLLDRIFASFCLGK